MVIKRTNTHTRAQSVFAVTGGSQSNNAITILLVIVKALATGYLGRPQTNVGLSMVYFLKRQIVL